MVEAIAMGTKWEVTQLTEIMVTKWTTTTVLDLTWIRCRLKIRIRIRVRSMVISITNAGNTRTMVTSEKTTTKVRIVAQVLCKIATRIVMPMLIIVLCQHPSPWCRCSSNQHLWFKEMPFFSNNNSNSKLLLQLWFTIARSMVCLILLSSSKPLRMTRRLWLVTLFSSMLRNWLEMSTLLRLPVWLLTCQLLSWISL